MTQHKRLLSLLVVVLGLVLSPKKAAASLSVQVTASHTEAEVGEVVIVQVRAIATSRGDILIQFPPVEGMTLLSQSESTQTSLSITSAGQSIRREKILQVELNADTPGMRNIPPVQATIGGESAQSSPLRIIVGGEKQEDKTITAKDGQVAPPGPKEQQIFVRYRVNQAKVWLGQEILLDFELFVDPRTRFQLDEIPVPPDLDGFWREMLFSANRLVPRTEIIEGRTYQAFRLWRLALYPLQAGNKTLDPVTVDLRVGGRGIFGGGRRIRCRPLKLELEVRPLPTEDRPSGFSSANVGQYTLTSKLDQTTIQAGKAVVLNLSLEGRGNIKSARLPELGDLDGFRIFPPTIKDEVDLQLSGLRGKKVAEILLVPTEVGQLEIPALNMPVFNPSEGKYATLTTPLLRVNVEGTLPASATPKAPPGETPSTEPPPGPSQTRRPLRIRASITEMPLPPWRSSAWWFTLLVGPLGLAAVSGGRVLREFWVERTQASFETLTWQREAQHQLNVAQEATQKGDAASAAAAFMEAFNAQARASLNVILQGRTTEEVKAALIQNGAEDNYAEEVSRALESASYARYAPGALSNDLEAAMKRWSELVEAVRYLRKKSG